MIPDTELTYLHVAHKWCMYGMSIAILDTAMKSEFMLMIFY